LKTIYIDDFINNDSTALSEITDFTKNKLVVKASTGIGGTSAILSITYQTVIIISPLVGMIQDKENQNEKPNNLFIYEGSRNNWKEVSDRISDEEQFILNCTPEQIISLKKVNPYLYKQIQMIPLFIDEIHLFAETDYRQSMAEFCHEVYTNWQNNFTLSTATPVYRNIDIPPHIKENLEVIRIQRRQQNPKPVTIYNLRNYEQWVLSELAKGNKVVLFSNDENIYKRFLQHQDINIQTLVGKKLEKKVATFRDAERLNLSDRLDASRNLFILSTKYLTGFDIPFPASVGIISNEMSNVDTRYINDIVQAYGRVRSTVINAAIFYHRNPSRESLNEGLILKGINYDLKNPILDLLTDGRVNHTLVINKHLPELLKHQTYGTMQSLVSQLSVYGFQPQVEYIDEVRLSNVGITLPEKVANLLSMEEHELKRFTDYVFMNMNGDNAEYNGFTDNLIMLYACAFIING